MANTWREELRNLDPRLAHEAEREIQDRLEQLTKEHTAGIKVLLKWYTDTRPYQPPEAQAELLDQLLAGLLRKLEAWA
jgi:hypothetical protein